MTRIIEVIVSPTGATKVETKGFAGATCREASRFLEQALGQSSHEELKAEFFEQPRVTETIREAT